MPLRDARSRTYASPRAPAALIALACALAPISARAQQATPQPATHTVKRGDTLWDLSKTYLGDPFLWPEIYRINTDLIEDPHWIYPGEVLKVPGETPAVVAEGPPVRVSPVAPASTPSRPAPITRDRTSGETAIQPPTSAVRMGEYIASPWVDQRGGPRVSGHLMGNRDLPGIASADHTRMNLSDAVLIAPPTGVAMTEHARYLTYALGPLIDGLGQIVVPTGIVEVTQSPKSGEAAVARVVALFGEMVQGQRLVPYDSAAALVAARPVAVANGRSGKVRWIDGGFVLPSIQSYVVVDISGLDISTGDQLELFMPSHPSPREGDPAIPEVAVARAQVMRVTQYGASAIITSQEQPKIEEGTAVRVAAKMP